MSGASGKTVKCTCGRMFATPAAMQQHKRSGKCGAQPKPQRSASRVKANGLAGAPVSQAVAVRETGTDSASVSGVDRLEHVEDISKYAHGGIVIDDLISASSFARLSKIAGAYQKVRYRKLAFRVVPMIPTSVGGGYVVAFVRDPADVPPTKGDDLLNWVTSQQGSITTKWWQSSAVSVPCADKVYYTSTSEEVREYSPGRLVVVVDGKATAAGPVTIFVDWSVTLTHASLEGTVIPGRPDHTVVQRNLWTKNQNTYVWSYDPSKSADSGSPNPELMFSDWKVGDLFMLPSAFTLEEYKKDGAGEAETENFWVLHVESVTGVRWRIHPDTTDSARQAADDVLIIPRGAVLRRVEQTTASLQGEAQPRGTYLTRASGSCSVSPSGRSGNHCTKLQWTSMTECPCGTPPQQATEPLWYQRLEGILTELSTEFRHCSRLLGVESSMRRPVSVQSDESHFEEIVVEEPTANGAGGGT